MQKKMPKLRRTQLRSSGGKKQQQSLFYRCPICVSQNNWNVSFIPGRSTSKPVGSASFSLYAHCPDWCYCSYCTDDDNKPLWPKHARTSYDRDRQGRLIGRIGPYPVDFGRGSIKGELGESTTKQNVIKTNSSQIPRKRPRKMHISVH